MLRNTHIAGLLSLALVAIVGILTIATAEPPVTTAQPPTPTEPPTPAELSFPFVGPPDGFGELIFSPDKLAAPGEPRSPAEQKIREAIEGNSSPSESGDGVLDDIIGVIKSRRSILDGSSLDPNMSGGEIDDSNANSKNARAAEQLLKASRLLEGVALDGKDRGDLVDRMRAEAEKLLSE